MYRVRSGFDKETRYFDDIGKRCWHGSRKLGAEGAACGTVGGVFGSSCPWLPQFRLSLQCTLLIRNKTCGRLGAGILSGFFGASTSVSGPPLVLYFLNEKLQDVMRANMIWFFGLSGFLTVLVNYFAVSAALLIGVYCCILYR